MTVSIICPIYNEEKYLRQCIESVLNQTLEDIELILINDGSTDSSGKICDEYASKDSRIKVIHQQNQGISVARENGFMAAKGNYIGFIDGDDYALSEMYEKLLDLLIRHTADISCCDHFFMDFVKTTEETPFEAIASTYDVNGSLFAAKQRQQEQTNNIFLWNKIFRRELFDKLDYSQFKLVAPHHYFDDIFLVQMLMQASKKIVKTNEKLYYYRQVEASLSRVTEGAHAKSRLEAFKIRIKLLKDYGYDELYDKQLKSYGNMLMKQWLENEDVKAVEDFKQIFKDLIIRGKCNLIYKISFAIFRINPKIWFQIARRFRYTHIDGERLKI